LKDKLLASAQVNITDITSTGLSGVASALLERDTGKVDFDIQLEDIGVSVSVRIHCFNFKLSVF